MACLPLIERELRVALRKQRPAKSRLKYGALAVCASAALLLDAVLVREPLPDPKDPRYKQWKVRERFPWGWGIIQEQLHERLARR